MTRQLVNNQRFIYPSLSYPSYSARIGLSKFQARIRIG
jgi:hypothetical protein